MPSSSPPPPPSSSSDHTSLPPLSTTVTPRLDSVAAFPRLSISIGQHATSSAESSAPGSPAVPFSPAHATNKSAASGARASPSKPALDRLARASSARARRATVSDAVASSSTSSYAEVIEMDPINPAGHRRRRSSLMSPSSSATPQTGRNGHARGPSVSGQFTMDEPKISEESEATIKGKSGFLRASPQQADFSDEDLHDDEETGLTAKERKRKQKKRRRNTLLDQRIARDNVTADEKKQADQSVVKKLTVNGCLIGLWYLFSLCISLVSPVLAPRKGGVHWRRRSLVLTGTTVQQMDVRFQPTQLSVPVIYDVCTHAGAVLSRLRGALLRAVLQTS